MVLCIRVCGCAGVCFLVSAGNTRCYSLASGGQLPLSVLHPKCMGLGVLPVRKLVRPDAVFVRKT
jgi:hypothetical protein